MLIGHFVCGLLKCRPVLLKNHYHAVRFGCESGSRHLPSSRHVIHYWLQPLRVTPVNRAGFAMTFPEGSGKFAPVAMSRQRERSCEAWCEGMPSLGVDTPAARSTHVRPHATFLSAIGGLPFFFAKKTPARCRRDSQRESAYCSRINPSLLAARRSSLPGTTRPERMA